MADNSIDFEALKRQGFLKSRFDGYLTLRTMTPAGNYTARQLTGLSAIAEKYARGMVHVTLRQGIEIPFVRHEDVEKIKSDLKNSGIDLGVSGPRLRAITCCPGSSWCKMAFIDTAGLLAKLHGSIDGLFQEDLPHKFKIAISGCPNMCTRGQVSEIGIFGVRDSDDKENKFGYGVYVGGCGGRNPRFGIKLEKIFSEEELMRLTVEIIRLYKENCKQRKRLAVYIEEIGVEKFKEMLKDKMK